jgi:lysophospholipase L1-like esterase
MAKRTVDKQERRVGYDEVGGAALRGARPRSAYEHGVARSFSARDALVCVTVAAFLLLVFQGPSIRRDGEKMDPGIERSLVLAVGKPAGWLGDRLPLADAAHDATAWISPDDDLSKERGFGAPGANAPRGVPPVTSNDARARGTEPSAPRPLHKLLVTGDSLATPLDVELARRLANADQVSVVRDPHLGTGISKSALVDWAKLSAQQVRKRRPDATVVFIGANEGFPMPGPGGTQVKCCGSAWAATFAYRVARMMDIYRQAGGARVYWLTLPTPRDGERARIATVVNAALATAAARYRAEVRLLDMGRTFTPGGQYRDAMEVDGKKEIVRESDGIHLNEVGAGVAADLVLAAMRRDFTW